jgi:uncharacterized protein YjbJ (UPF0337 family)
MSDRAQRAQGKAKEVKGSVKRKAGAARIRSSTQGVVLNAVGDRGIVNLGRCY